MKKIDISSIICLILIFIVALLNTFEEIPNPSKNLVEKINNLKPQEEIKLDKTTIYELIDLYEEINNKEINNKEEYNGVYISAMGLNNNSKIIKSISLVNFDKNRHRQLYSLEQMEEWSNNNWLFNLILYPLLSIQILLQVISYRLKYKKKRNKNIITSAN